MAQRFRAKVSKHYFLVHLLYLAASISLKKRAVIELRKDPNGRVKVFCCVIKYKSDRRTKFVSEDLLIFVEIKKYFHTP